MCGRARCTLGPDDVPRACHRTSGPSRTIDIHRYRPAYNVSPGFYVPVVRRDDDGAADADGYAVHCMRWGLIPSFTNKSEKPDFYRMFNAKAESIGEKASFRRLIPKNRCLVAVEGFYEWKKDGSKKQPYYIHFKDGRPLVFAALYDSWKNSEGETLYTFTIITTSSSKALNWLHDRTPVILGDKAATDTWLKGSSTGKYDTLLKPYEDSDLVWYPVTPAMGKQSFDGPECIKETPLKTQEKNPITKFFVKKETKEEKESSLVKDNSSDNPVETDLQKSMKKEQDTENKLEPPAFIKKEGYEMNADALGSPQENETKYAMKREREEIQTYPKLDTNQQETERTSPAKKRATAKSDGDKQPTLLSYFGRK